MQCFSYAELLVDRLCNEFTLFSPEGRALPVSRQFVIAWSCVSDQGAGNLTVNAHNLHLVHCFLSRGRSTTSQ